MLRVLLLLTLFVNDLAWSQMTTLPALTEVRYCGTPRRTATGLIIRRTDVTSAFRKIHQCPSTGLYNGACPGWAMNHVIPLACGGCDAVSNLQWLPNDIKSSSSPHAIDRFERSINAPAVPFAGTDNCVNVKVP